MNNARKSLNKKDIPGVCIHVGAITWVSYSSAMGYMAFAK